MDLSNVRARLSVVDPLVLGARIRTARVSAGLTQGEVAGGRLSISYLSRIESGKRRPVPDLLIAVAERLELDPVRLLDGETDEVEADRSGSSDSSVLDFAEIAVDMGDPEVARAHLDGHDLTGLPARDRRRAEKVMAQALEATGDLNGAIELLERILVQTGIEQERVPLAMMLSRCHRELGELDNATRVGEEALTRATTLGLGACVEVVQLTVTVAAAYFEKGELDHALRLCRQALVLAEALDSPTARASAYWETSMVTMGQGDPDAAVVLARRALALMGEGADNRILPRLRIHVGLMELKMQTPEVASARATLTAAADEMRLNHSTGTERIAVELGLARCDLLDGDPDSAWLEGQRLLPLAERISPVSGADVLTLLGETAAARGDVDGVRQCLLQAVHRLHAVDSPREAGQRWLQLGAMLEHVGELEAAVSAYRAAAVSTGLRPLPLSMPDLVVPNRHDQPVRRDLAAVNVLG